ncbi:hypothetical protein OCF84_20955 (plasmid) [Shewanella xiamenensis]|uniref:Uncharacterized protein n=1 Tax=Shewanella xiamenensis TaxID=332186 RepID=A0ABT6UHN7_9GAMM|nr:hypothetical protein [Shewanella xiamenensis]MDI5833260.1 hypothetical protein [Shewanella xiamenensis]WHF57989.1 hypothetical protein OCF84_20955 [Shewanella xiamenensis]
MKTLIIMPKFLGQHQTAEVMPVFSEEQERKFVMSDNQTTALATVITICILALFSTASDFDIQKHWLALVFLAPIAFVGAYGVIGVSSGWK